MMSRKSPEEPPSSATVTTAVISTSLWRKLRRMTGIPVPPPITVILGFFMNDSPSPYVDPYHDVFH